MGNPPLRARLHWYRLTAAEFALLTAMCEHCSDGSLIRPSIKRLAAYSKLSERKVQYVIRELLARGILSQLAPPNSWRRCRPAIYRLNEKALPDDPKMAPYRQTGQSELFGVTGAQCAPVGVQSVRVTGAQCAPDSKTINSNSDSKTGGEKYTSPKFSQTDFDQRDLRKIADAYREAEKRPNSVGGLDDKQFFVWICQRAGITVQRGLYLEKLQSSWPEEPTA